MHECVFEDALVGADRTLGDDGSTTQGPCALFQRSNVPSRIVRDLGDVFCKKSEEAFVVCRITIRRLSVVNDRFVLGFQRRKHEGVLAEQT